MNIINKIKSITLVMFLLALPGLVWAQCVLTKSVIAGSGAQTYTSSGSQPGYTQLYSLVDATGTVVEVSSTGTFSASNFATAGVSFTVHALNYKPTDAPSPLPTPGSLASACGSILPGCRNPDYETDYICINVIDCTDICQGTSITASSTGSTPGYIQQYLLVDAAGLVVAIDDDAVADFSTASLATGTYTVHAVNYNPADPPSPLPTVGAPASDCGSDLPGCLNPDFLTDFICFTIVSPLSAGADNSAFVCESDGMFEIATLLDPTAVTGGVWTSSDPAFDETTGMVDLATASSPVIIVYTVTGSGACASATDLATFIIIINETVTANAGADLSTACETPVSLNASGTGTWSGAGLGSLSDPTSPMSTFTPDVAQGGSNIVLTWTVPSNGACPSASDNVIVAVGSCSTTLTAVDDVISTSTAAGESIELNILSNDVIPSGVTPTVTITSFPLNGSVEVNPDGTITYTPGPGFSGTDDFEYTISDGAGNSSIGIVNLTITVPVTLISSFINSDCEAVSLVWNVGVESNVASYTIARSADGVTFENVATIPAVNSTSSTTYNYSDAYRLNSRMYYRIIANNTNASSEVLRIMTVESNCSENVDFTNVYPNPVKDILFYEILSSVNQSLTMEIVDATGRVHTSNTIQVNAGKNTFNTNIVDMASGIYFIGIRNETGEMINFKKFVKAN